ncbi:hypothetical protein OROGR_016918 [Orobanche gracilis]
MDPPTVVKTFHCNPSQLQQHIFSATVLEQTPLPYRSFSRNKNKTQDHDADTKMSIFDAQKYFCENMKDPKLIKTQSRKKEEPSSLETIPRLSSVSSTGSYGRNFRSRSFHSTPPTASSEAIWKSQTGVLVNPPGSVRQVSLKKYSSDDDGKKIKVNPPVSDKWTFFGRRSCCSGKKSVRVKEATISRTKMDSHRTKALSSTSGPKGDRHHHVVEIQRNKILPQNHPAPSSPENNFPTRYPSRQHRISGSGRSLPDGAGGFSFPILKNPTQAAKPGPRGSMISPVGEDPPRDSPQVFRRRFVPGSPVACVASTDDDMGSDASSDLFEIDSFSTQTASYPMYRRRDSLDEAPTFNARNFASAVGVNNLIIEGGSLEEPPTPTASAAECYPPSEVSIDWSVATAEGFDRPSISSFSVSASEVGGAAFFQQRLKEEADGDSGDCPGEKRKGNGGGLLLMSCRQEKDVSVGQAGEMLADGGVRRWVV